MEKLENILREVKSYILSSPDVRIPVMMMAGFGVSREIIGAHGDDEQGKLFVCYMSTNGVNLSRLRMIKGPTAQCVCLVDELGNRTMRPSLSSAVKVQANELTRDDFKGAKMVRDFRSPLLQLLESGDIDLCFANEDEAKELIGRLPSFQP